MSQGLFPGIPLPEELFMVVVGMPGKNAYYLMPNAIRASSSIRDAGTWPKEVANHIREELARKIEAAQEPEWVWIEPLVNEGAPITPQY